MRESPEGEHAPLNSRRMVSWAFTMALIDGVATHSLQGVVVGVIAGGLAGAAEFGTQFGSTKTSQTKHD